MKVSAVIPTFNRRAQVLKAIESVIAQTVPVEEIIVVDDGSTDGTAEAIGGCYGSRVTVFSQANAGAAAARNRGIREARGEWIGFLDSDDIWLPTKIERQLEALSTLEGNFGLCFTDAEFDGDPELKASVFKRAGFGSALRFGVLDEPTRYMLAELRPVCTPCILVSRSLLSDMGGFDDSLAIGEDWDLIFRLSFRARFCYVAETLVRIDRSPSRAIGLEKLFSTRDDRIYDSFERLYGEWLKMPEVAGGKYEHAIRQLLRLVYYSSIEAKMHEFRLGPAFRRIALLRAHGENLPSIAVNLFTRKIKKMRHGSKN